MRVAISAIALLACTSLASAADLGGPYEFGGSIKDGPVIAAQPSWTGLYVGGHVGYGWGEWDGDLKTRDVITHPWKPSWPDPAANSISQDANGWLAGGQLGYNYQMGSVVVGLEADLSWTDMDGSSGPHSDDLKKWSKTVDAELDYFGTARIRLGYAVGRLMPYITGGLAWGRSQIQQEVFYSADGLGLSDPDGYVSGRGDDSNTHVGWTIGGGIEAMLADGWSIKAEYLYVDLGEEEYAFRGTHFNKDGSVRNPDWAQDGYDADLDFHTVRVGVNYKFGN